VIRAFIEGPHARNRHLSHIRLLQCARQYAVAIDAVKEAGALAEVCICYTGDLLSPGEKYNRLLSQACQGSSSRGRDILAIKGYGWAAASCGRLLVPELRDCGHSPASAFA
jgi:pyruvate carboxylase